MDELTPTLTLAQQIGGEICIFDFGVNRPFKDIGKVKAEGQQVSIRSYKININLILQN